MLQALLAAPGTCDVLATHKGFVKLAIETGSSIVPVVAFGENDAFDTYVPERGSRLDKALKLVKKYTGFATPLFWGVGLLSGRGLLPKGVPLNTVVGTPIVVARYTPSGPQDEKLHFLVEEYHARYLEAMQAIYDTHKDAFAPTRKRDLRFIR